MFMKRWVTGITVMGLISTLGITVALAAADGIVPLDAGIPVSGISLNYSSLILCTGDTVTLSATVSPADATDQTVIWSVDNESSENEAIATVTDGVVTAANLGTVNIRATTQDGNFQAVCSITIKADKIASTKYQAGGGLLSGIAKYTKAETFKSNLYNAPADIRIYKADGAELTSGNVGTGMAVALMVEGAERDRLGIVVNGDTTGDGNITIADYTLTRLNILGLKALEGSYRAAADLNGDGNVTIADYTLMRLDILSLKPINGSAPDLPGVSDPRIRSFLDVALAQQGKPYVWSDEGPDSFDCSGYIYYCLRQVGYSVGRTTADSYSRRSSWQYVSRDALQPGDLMFYYSDNPNDGDHIGHTGIYLGNGYHIHASSDYGFIVISRVEGWYDRMLSHGRRVFS